MSNVLTVLVEDLMKYKVHQRDQLNEVVLERSSGQKDLSLSFHLHQSTVAFGIAILEHVPFVVYDVIEREVLEKFLVVGLGSDHVVSSQNHIDLQNLY